MCGARDGRVPRRRGKSDLSIPAIPFGTQEFGNPLDNQNVHDLEQNVAAISTPLPPGVLDEFIAAGL